MDAAALIVNDVVATVSTETGMSVPLLPERTVTRVRQRIDAAIEKALQEDRSVSVKELRRKIEALEKANERLESINAEITRDLILTRNAMRPAE